MTQPVIIVSGLPRSGTSMMMQMLASGGIEIGTDNKRKPDTNNPKGYYEIEKIKDLKKDSTWVQNMRGRAIKVISSLLYYLPENLQYKIIFMQRDMQEILDSQKKMLNQLGEDNKSDNDASLAKKFDAHLQKVQKWIKNQSNIECLYVKYNDILVDPLPYAQNIQRFLQFPMNVEGMASVIDESLYRSKGKNIN